MAGHTVELAESRAKQACYLNLIPKDNGCRCVTVLAQDQDDDDSHEAQERGREHSLECLPRQDEAQGKLNAAHDKGRGDFDELAQQSG